MESVSCTSVESFSYPDYPILYDLGVGANPLKVVELWSSNSSYVLVVDDERERSSSVKSS